MDYHGLYLNMFGAAADTVDVLNATIDALVALREKLILEQQEAEEVVICTDDDLDQTG